MCKTGGEADRPQRTRGCLHGKVQLCHRPGGKHHPSSTFDARTNGQLQEGPAFWMIVLGSCVHTDSSATMERRRTHYSAVPPTAIAGT